MATHFFTNGKKTVQADAAAADILRGQTDEKDKPIWAEISDPNPPQPTQEEVALADHTGQIEIVHSKSGKKGWCENGQCQTMLDTGWELVHPDSFKPEVVKASVKEEPKESPKEEPPAELSDELKALKTVLEGLDHKEDGMWNSKGEINITSLRALVPNVTRKEVEAAIPGFKRTLG